MSDTCKHCMVRGNIIECQETPCHTHVSWYAQQQQAEIERLTRKVEYLSKNKCMGCIDAICDDCAGKEEGR